MTAHSKIYIRMIAVNLSRQLGLPCADEADIREMYNSRVPQPIVLRNENGSVWLDPYYAAFKLPGGEITYVYISKTHILEELLSCRAVREKRRTRYHLPAAISRQFRRAVEYMRDTGSDAWVETRDYGSLEKEGFND